LCPGGPCLRIRRRLHGAGSLLPGKAQPGAAPALSPEDRNGGSHGGTTRTGPGDPGSAVLEAEYSNLNVVHQKAI